MVKISRTALEVSAASNCSASARSSIGTTTPPAARMASADTIQTGELGAQIAIRLPWLTPASCSPRAKRNAVSPTILLSQLATPSSANAITPGCWPRAVRSRSKPAMSHLSINRTSSSQPPRWDRRHDIHLLPCGETNRHRQTQPAVQPLRIKADLHMVLR